ncbi:MAG: 2-hydroxyacyl-CoA dehydratase [Chloroflexi bacterium]|nr:2-hydroxyacyl-CoA dehydratase [Chloroflexota bacterium]
MQRFGEILKNRHQYARDWKAKTGGKVLGYFEPYMPEEVAYAAGLLPVRLLSEHEPDDISDRHMYGNCACSRDIINQVAKGRYDYLEGLCYAEACQWMRNAFASSLRYMKSPYNHYVFVPDYVDGPRSPVFMRSELASFKKSLEEWTGKTITDESLDHAIDVYNTNRRLMRQIYELRRAENPPLSGTEAMEMVLASQVMDKEEQNHLLKEMLEELPERGTQNNTGVRLMLVGSPASDSELERLIESLGATVVIDELCTGSAYFWNEVIPQKDRLMAIALRYLDKPHCALKDNNYRRRPAHIRQLLEAYNAHGVIISKQIYCHNHGADVPMVWTTLRERYVPFHYLERDTRLPVGETLTRIEAFINVLQGERVA